MDATSTPAADVQRRQIEIIRRSPHYWRVNLDNPPLNIMGPQMVQEFSDLVTEMENALELKVVVIGSTNPDYFMAHYDVLRDPSESINMAPGPTGMHPVPDAFVRLSRLPVVSIASIRGRATGSGSEIALACDIRFASREKAVLSHWEVGAGFVPGGGPMARMPRLMGRGRALEVLLGADDIPGDLAELYGYVNRALPDDELDRFVDEFALRIASFNRDAIAATKRFVDDASLPADSEMQPAWDAFVTSVGQPFAQDRLSKFVKLGLQQPSDIEKRLGFYVGPQS
ncbi:enoyl-CoA hydratase/isomerase family protein [Sinorhizobium sp. 8-89]|uniref:enoyl-CoA hydratase/isomerase family protein n=1 Tax=Sinorhizobium sp. 7-81 TaxID=3049087 RepID=UPI0024C30CC6|nr:enoyl-CoA hydratase/isomerase family protein [Sinorhizobium sp. 7-81]MDK1386528.1 enoyl-CoA hydratase/isomerase family protein [Sinorhizobium sp. 7-81]